MSWMESQPPGLVAAADQELAGLREWVRELAAEHPHVVEQLSAVEALFALAQHIGNAVEPRPGVVLVAATAVDMLAATQAEAVRWEGRYAEMLKQRDAALHELAVRGRAEG